MIERDSIKEVGIEGESFSVKFDFDRELLDSLKAAIPAGSRHFDRILKLWYIDFNAAFALEGWSRANGFDISHEAEAKLTWITEKGIEQASNDETPAELIIDVLGDDRFIILFPYHEGIKNAVRAIPNRLWTGKYWEVPVDSAQDVRDFASLHNFKFTEAAEAILNKILGKELEIRMEGIKGEPFPFQKAGTKFQIAKKRTILGDEMGLGKSLTSICSVVETNTFPCLVVCPKKLILNWRNEWNQWTDRSVHVVGEKTTGSGLYKKNVQFHGMMVANGLTATDVYIVNYDSLDKILHVAHKFKSIILDEVHLLRNAKTKRTKSCMKLCAGKEYIFSLTGTPVVNSTEDLYTILKLLNHHEKFGGDKGFKHAYIDTQRDKKWGPIRHKELNQKLNEICYLKREKRMVQQELPPKIRQEIYVPLANQAVYDLARKDLSAFLKTHKNKSDAQIRKTIQAEAFTKIMYLKRIAAEGKLEAGIELAETFLEAGEKVVLFAHHREIIESLKNRLGTYNPVVIHGDIGPDEVDANVKAFQNDPNCKVIICSIRAGGVGLTLTASCRVIFFELGWTPAEMEQAESRSHRIGTKDTVYCYYLLGTDTVDTKINNIIKRKRGIADAVAGVTTVIETSVYEDLFTYLQGEAA